MLILFSSLVTRAGAGAQSVAIAQITSPREGEVLQGQVHVMGTADGPDFASAVLEFSYASDSTKTWFEVQTIYQGIRDSELGTWDTTTISDGNYLLRLNVISQAGVSADEVVRIQVRNYTSPPTVAPPVETPSAGLQIPTAVMLVASPTSGPFRAPTPTNLPANPASIATLGIYDGFWQGALVVGGIFAVVGLIFLRRRA